MATHCKKCGGTIPDVMIDGSVINRNDCNHHIKPEINIKF